MKTLPIKSVEICVLGALWAVLISVASAAEPVTVVPEKDGVQRLTMILDSYSYKPDRVVVRAGLPVELILISETTLTPHNFVMKEPDAGIDINKDVPAGETVTVRFTATKPGTYPFYCDRKLLFFKSHREKGMEGILSVTK